MNSEQSTALPDSGGTMVMDDEGCLKETRERFVMLHPITLASSLPLLLASYSTSFDSSRAEHIKLHRHFFPSTLFCLPSSLHPFNRNAFLPCRPRRSRSLRRPPQCASSRILQRVRRHFHSPHPQRCPLLHPRRHEASPRLCPP